MAEKRKGKRRKEDVGAEESEKPSKDEIRVAKWLKKNVLVKKTKFLYHNVEYFTGSKAVDALLVSPMAETLFPTRSDIVFFLDTMLRHKFFHRALKVPVSEEEILARKRRKKGEKEKEKEKEKESDTKDEAESSHAEGKAEDPSASPKASKERKTKKRKIRLEMHINQYFEDGLDAYVWIYDPIPLHYWIFGTLLVLGAIGVCLFPLWPPEVRKGVYYLSIAAAGFLCLIITLAVIRFVVFCIVWCLSMGRHHFWFLPNLTEDVGFLASFWPLYQYEYKGEAKQEKGKKKKKAKDSDDEQEDDKPDEKEVEGDGDTQDQQIEGDERASRSESESESSSQKSQTGRDFEIVEKEEVEETSPAQ